MQPYIDLCNRVYMDGVDVVNDRSGAICRTVISHTIRFDCSGSRFHPVSVRFAPRKLAVAEFLGYIKGYHNAKQFRDLGAPTWDANANETKEWLENPNRQGQDDLGRIYGTLAHSWPRINRTGNIVGWINLYQKVYNDLLMHKDDRREILTYWNPGEFDNGALPPCLHSFQFSILDGKLYVDATQRSADVLIGTVANITQVQFFLILMAHLVGLEPAVATLHMVNCHMYGNQIEVYEELQIGLKPLTNNIRMVINPRIKTLQDVITMMSPEDVTYEGEYNHHPKIRYPFQA